MNLNPLFFNKLVNDPNLTNGNGINPIGQSYLFADIINITCEELSADDQSKKTDSPNLGLSFINDIDIQILVSDGLLAAFTKVISESTSETESKNIYNLDDAKITKSDNLVNEEALLALISGLNRIITPEISKLDLINNSLSEDSNQSIVQENNDDISKNELTLDVIKNVLENHNTIKLTLKSESEKVTIQISREEVGNTDSVHPQVENIPEFSKQELPYKLVAEQDVDVIPKVDLPEGKKVKAEVNKEVNKLEQQSNELHQDNQTDIPSANVKSRIKESEVPKFKVEITHSEMKNDVSKTSAKPKIPFILDIKTSREIGEFLSKYSNEDVSLTKQVESSDNQIQNNTLPEQPEKVDAEIVNKSEMQEGRLIYIKGNQLINNEIEVIPDLKRTSSENLRAIKIESPGKIEFEEQAKIVTNKDEFSQLTDNIKESDSNLEASVGEKKVQTESEINVNVKENFVLKKNEVPLNEEKKNIVEVSNQVIKENLTNDSKDNFSVSKKNSTVEQTIKEDETTLTAQSKEENISVSQKSASDSNSSNNSEKDLRAESQSKELKPKKEKNEVTSDENVITAKPVKDSVKHTEFSNNLFVDKKPVEVNELTNKVITSANTFKETFKKVKSTEVVSEISKYLNTSEKQSITFQLTPKNLGTVKLTVDFVENSMKAIIEVENEQIRQTIQSNVEQLKTTLQNNGIQLSSINVNLSNGEPKAHKQFTSKKRAYNNFNEPKVEQKSELTGKKKLGYNTYEYLV